MFVPPFIVAQTVMGGLQSLHLGDRHCMSLELQASQMPAAKDSAGSLTAAEDSTISVASSPKMDNMEPEAGNGNLHQDQDGYGLEAQPIKVQAHLWTSGSSPASESPTTTPLKLELPVKLLQ
eukprot:TRINITY_DN9789_c0_g1_i2.p1 TRINITY_DN9789_c0_g1~~TRINITY_DN9789_c0_g1_i2.p1  ORF type:complete len:122 (+),score=26.85 TRINITY_DN9789_c0_g1_i2:53-418(+)